MPSYRAAFRGFVERVPERRADRRRTPPTPRSSTSSPRARAAEVAWFALEGDDTGTCSRRTGWRAPAPADASGQPFDLLRGRRAAGACRCADARGTTTCATRSPRSPRCAGLRRAAATCATGARSPRFEGVRRRQDLLFEARGVRVYDDFAHHPTAVDETLRALRARHPEGALWAVFEPRSATACRALHQEQLRARVRPRRLALLAPLGRSDIPEAERLDLARLARATAERGQARRDGGDERRRDRRARGRDARPGDTVALLSNGAFGGIHEKLLARL